MAAPARWTTEARLASGAESQACWDRGPGRGERRPKNGDDRQQRGDVGRERPGLTLPGERRYAAELSPVGWCCEPGGRRPRADPDESTRNRTGRGDRAAAHRASDGLRFGSAGRAVSLPEERPANRRPGSETECALA